MTEFWTDIFIGIGYICLALGVIIYSPPTTMGYF